MNDALQRIADLAPTLSGSEVRVLIELSRRALSTATTSTTASSRDLAEATKIGRPNVQAAIAELNRRGLVSSDKGSATRAAQHELSFLRVVPIGRGYKTEPPPQQEVAIKQSHPGYELEPGVATKQSHPGYESEPPLPLANNACTRAPAIEISDSSTSEADRSTWRLLNAKQTDYDAASLELARGLMHSHTQKFGKPTQDAPDDKICAELLCVFAGDTIATENFFYALSAERKKPGESWAWYVTVAVQRTWRMPPDELRERRQRLSQMLKRQPASQSSQRHGAAELASAIAAAAQQKGMR